MGTWAKQGHWISIFGGGGVTPIANNESEKNVEPHKVVFRILIRSSPLYSVFFFLSFFTFSFQGFFFLSFVHFIPVSCQNEGERGGE